MSEGDSFSVFWGGNHTGMYAAARPTQTHIGRAVGGSRVTATNGLSLTERFEGSMALNPTHLTVLIGANDMTTSGDIDYSGAGNHLSPDPWLNSLWSYVGNVKSRGVKVAVGTIMPLCYPTNTLFTSAYNQRRIKVNAALRAAVGTKIDGVIDFAADPEMRDDADACSQTFFQADGLHPNFEGQKRMAITYTAAVDALVIPTAPSFVETSKIHGTIVPVDDGLDFVAQLNTMPSPPPSMAPDVVGAFRFICGPGQANYDDPIVYPGLPGKAHLHNFFGNLNANGMSNYESLRKSGRSTCTNDLNRSAYWIPALMDGRGNYVKPNLMSTYYKRLPAADAIAKGFDPVPIPPAMRGIFGWNYATPSVPQKRRANFLCAEKWTPKGPGGSMEQALNECKAVPDGPDKKLMAQLTMPPCWNGKDLDSADHRSHLADAYSDVSTGYKSRCPASHPKLIPTFTTTVEWTIAAGDNTDLWEFSSGHMALPGTPRGDTYHMDLYMSWNDRALKTWTDNCIDKMLSCTSGMLGDLTIMKSDFAGKGYPGYANPRLIPIPPRP